VFSPTKGTAVHEYAFVGVLRVKIGSTACQDHHRGYFSSYSQLPLNF